ncbi:MAG: hypothetical protein AB7O91_04165 [Sphingomonas sp.]
MTWLELLRRFWWAIPIIGLAIALLITRATLERRTAERDVAVAFGNLVTEATRAAAGNPRLARGQVPAQIDAMGRGLDTLRAGLERCNASARAAADNDARRQQAAATAVQAARERAQGAEATAARLRASAARGADPGGECEASEAVRETWR